MPNYLSPGVYVEEVRGGPKPIGMVGTRTAGFLGPAPKANALPNEPKALNNWSEFERHFGGEGTKATVLSRAVYGFYNNGGGRCFVVNTAKGGIAGDPDKRTGVEALRAIDEIAMVAAPGATDAASYEALLSFCESRGDCFAILDAPEEANKNPEGLKEVASAGGATGDVAAAKGMRPRRSAYGAVYFPWIEVTDPETGGTVAQPPSGHLAGVYARTDAERGVHKAPANTRIRGALDLGYRVTEDEQGELNRLGVNCIRFFSDAGILIWGARTLDGEASEKRYISVARLILAIKESIQEGTRWVVFEPNDELTWGLVRRDVTNFLTGLWRTGALKGSTAEQAFFVKCDAETNPQDVVDRGELVTEIGICPVKPAEFIIFRIAQWSGAEAVTESA